MVVLLVGVDGCVTAREATLRERLLACLLADALDRDLAGGVSPDASGPLALRARKLARSSTRRALARSLERVLADTAARGPRRPTSTVPVRRDRVIRAWDEIQELIRGLLAPGPVSVRGLAQVHILLTDGKGPSTTGTPPTTWACWSGAHWTSSTRSPRCDPVLVGH